jgi:ABC-type multidrug transport system ATPase subunit
MKIILKNISKSFGEIKVLNNINLEISSGEKILIIGENGVGKTTLLKIIGLILKPDKGELIFDNYKIPQNYHLTSKEIVNIRRKIGFIQQEPIMLSGSVLHNIQYGLKIRKKELPPFKITAIDDILTKNSRKISGGEKKIVAIARVLVINPEVYLFDEPFNNLAPKSSEIIENCISEISNSGKTVILTTHNIDYIENFTDKIFYLENGILSQEKIHSYKISKFIRKKNTSL